MEAYIITSSSPSPSPSTSSLPFINTTALLFPSSRSSTAPGQIWKLKYLSESHDGLTASNYNLKCRSSRRGYTNIPSVSFYPENEERNFFERLIQAWKVLFPGPSVKHVSNAAIAKQRLKMILISDRCEISDVAKQKIVNNVVGALSSFVEIESEEKVQLNVSADPALGTVYSVIVPVRRVKAEYQEYGENLRNTQYGDSLETMRTLDLRFEHVDDGVE